ncbi:hypothetical protein KCU81_g3267, partial [Aureobasidium melanogenum]|uniref:Uncharacterized protein n=1 Tax=Aureobasidium melanogenum (strain CBS 110374) TaxID=1043003 RepID=A0A074VMJ8_AURM1
MDDNPQTVDDHDDHDDHDDQDNLQTLQIPMTLRQWNASKDLIMALLRNSIIHTYRWTADTNVLEILYPRQNDTANEAGTEGWSEILCQSSSTHTSTIADKRLQTGQDFDMLESFDLSLSLDGLLKLLAVFILLSVLVALLQSDATVGAVRRAVKNCAALPLLLIADLISGVETVLASGHARSIFAIVQNTIFGIAGYSRKIIKDANISARTRDIFLTVYRTTVQYVDAAQLLTGRIKRLFAIAQALLTIACEAVIDYIRVLRTGRSISDDVLSMYNVMLCTSIRIISLLYVVSKGLGNLVSTIAIWIHTRLRKSDVYASSADLLLSMPAIVSHKLDSFWSNIRGGLNQKLTAVLELIFSDGYTMESSFLDSSAGMSSLSTDVAPASNSDSQSPWKGRLRTRPSDTFRRQRMT